MRALFLLLCTFFFILVNTPGNQAGLEKREGDTRAHKEDVICMMRCSFCYMCTILLLYKERKAPLCNKLCVYIFLSTCTG